MCKKLFLLIALTALTLYISGYSEELYTEIKNEATLPILSPTFSDHNTLKIQLKNGLEAYIISDPYAQESAAALTVRAGSWQDPEETPGMAHLVEHMLFLGTVQHPDESGYDTFITEHGGSSNAYTRDLQSTYLFSIQNNFFSEAMDRFSSFFKQPLFNPSGLARELQAIDQEYAKSLNDDVTRLYQVIKELSDPAHPGHRFSMGNSSTLTNITQNAIRNWYQTHYSANLMSLIIYSSLPLDTLKALVIRDFSGVPNRSLPVPLFSSKRTSEEYDGKMIYVTPVKHENSLIVMWELPPLFAKVSPAKPELFTCYVLGDEGRNSLLAKLKAEHLATELSCGTTKLTPDDLTLFISIDLTSDGLVKVNQVIEMLFQTINNFKAKGVPPYLYADLHNLTTINYQYPFRKDPYDTVSSYANAILNEDLATFPEHSTVLQKFDPPLVEALLNLLTPQRAQYYLMAPQEETGVTPDKKEKWMDVLYTVRPIPAELLRQWSQVPPNPTIELPPPNPFIPQHLSLINGEVVNKAFPQPKAIVKDDKATVYYAADTQYLTPEVFCSFEVKSPLIDNGKAIQVVLADLYIKSLNESLSQVGYQAQVGRISYDFFTTTNNGLAITLSGFSEKAPLLFEDIVKALKVVKPTPNAFQTYREALRKSYLNFAKEGSNSQAQEIFKDVIFKDFVMAAEKVKAIESISYGQFMNFATSLYNTAYVEGMVYGNVTEAEALDYWNKLDGELKSSPYPSDHRKRQEVIRFPNDKGPYYLKYNLKSQGNSTLLAIEHPPFTFKGKAAQLILTQAIKQPFFSALRTKQQTGYLVHSMAQEVNQQLFNLFLVQSNTHNARDLLARFELEIETFVQEISSDLPQERFERIKESIVTALEQPPTNLKEMGRTLNSLAFSFGGNFNYLREQSMAAKNLSYEECLDYGKRVFGKANKQRLAILIRGDIPEENIFHYSEIKSLESYQKMSQYVPMQ
jgi:insulysin